MTNKFRLVANTLSKTGALKLTPELKKDLAKGVVDALEDWDSQHGGPGEETFLDAVLVELGFDLDKADSARKELYKFIQTAIQKG